MSILQLKIFQDGRAGLPVRESSSSGFVRYCRNKDQVGRLQTVNAVTAFVFILPHSFYDFYDTIERGEGEGYSAHGGFFLLFLRSLAWGYDLQQAEAGRDRM